MQGTDAWAGVLQHGLDLGDLIGGEGEVPGVLPEEVRGHVARRVRGPLDGGLAAHGVADGDAGHGARDEDGGEGREDLVAG